MYGSSVTSQDVSEELFSFDANPNDLLFFYYYNEKSFKNICSICSSAILSDNQQVNTEADGSR